MAASKFSPTWWNRLTDGRLRRRRVAYMRLTQRAIDASDLRLIHQAISLVALCDREIARRRTIPGRLLPMLFPNARVPDPDDAPAEMELVAAGDDR